MSNLYVTADSIGGWSGGSQVTFHESQALASLGPCEVWGRQELIESRKLLDPEPNQEPWAWDNAFCYDWPLNSRPQKYPKLAHFYAGTFSRGLQFLKDVGVKTTYTAAAHDVAASRREHELLGIPYDYPHLTDPALWERYLAGYKAADVLICPSKHSADVMRGFGCTNRIEIIPHGVDLPKCKRCNGEKGYYEYDDPDTGKKDYFIDCPEVGCWTHEGSTGLAPIAPLPERFTVGYLGAIGPDKGLRYLIEAWKKLDYHRDEAVLMLAGRDSRSQFMTHLIRTVFGDLNRQTLMHGGGLFGEPAWSTTETLNKRARIVRVGWIGSESEFFRSISEFYNALSVYVQPSVTEGFGIEVLEAMACGRAVLCSEGAGACDLLKHRYYAPDAYTFKAGDVDKLVEKIDWAKKDASLVVIGQDNRSQAENYTWDKVRSRYVQLWRELIS